MKASYLPALALALFSFAMPSNLWIHASTGDLPETVAPQVESGLVLPCWQPDEYQGNFDIRIWPEDVVIWLERENLKSMVNDPNIPAEERAALKRILAMQTSFHNSSGDGR